MPDPTKLTDAAIERATASFRREIASLRELLETRLAGMDKATELLALSVDRFPTETDKAVHSLRELLEARIDAMDKATRLLADDVSTIPRDIEKSAAGLKNIIETRLAAMDEATKLLATNVDKVPYAILQEAGNLKAFIMSKIDDVSHVNEEKFDKVNAQFVSNDKALTAALAAQEKAAAEQQKSNTLAIDKSERTTQETIRANDAKTASTISAQAATIADLKDRLVRLEAGGVAVRGERSEQREARGESRLNLNAVVSIGLLVLALLTFVVLYVAKK